MTPHFVGRTKGHFLLYITKALHKSLTAPSTKRQSFRSALLRTDLFVLEPPVFWTVLHQYQHPQTAGTPWRVAVSSAHPQQHNGLSLEKRSQITSENPQNYYHHIWVIPFKRVNPRILSANNRLICICLS